MAIVTEMVVVGVALLHVYFLILEMFLWNKPKGLQVFGHSLENAIATKVLAANQGLYNGFIAAGLVWGLLQGHAGFENKLFFLCCVLVAGIFGGLTASKKILYVQAIPGLVGLVLVVISN